MRKRKRMLYIEDDAVIREDVAKVLRQNWEVETAEDGRQALEMLQAHGRTYSVIVLDLRMPKLTGEQVLEHIQDEGLRVAPIIVLSAYIDDDVENKCRYLGAAHVLRKPYEPRDLSKMAEVISGGTPPVNTELKMNDKLLDFIVERRRRALHAAVVSQSQGPEHGSRFPEPVFVVARRWNSWYPSFFPVAGGAYAVLAGGAHPDTASGPGDVSCSAVIDPGFRFIDQFRRLALPLSGVDSCVITHNHPDHLGGIFELMAARHAMSKRTRVLCSASCAAMIGDCSGFLMEVKQLGDNPVDLLPEYRTGEKIMRLRVASFDTAHEEIGRDNSSKGLCICSESKTGDGRHLQENRLVLLGDTVYERGRHRQSFIPMLCSANVKVVVLHIGSSQNKEATGKHLYLPGLQNILIDMNTALDGSYNGTLLVLVSEWGLEHATRTQISKVCGNVAGFDNYSPILETVKFLRRDLKLHKICVLPADIGLVVGIESGQVYLEGIGAVAPDAVAFAVDEDGLTYSRKG